ncbi:MAG: hypothetical protein VKO21_00850 [Candidatus Sericytochromatia bacterium]|nr:hypothetical protein [Candidatus Sericytochromatia bacterium]
MTSLLEPSLWIGLLTLVILEIVLGIDNLVFVAILAEKVEPSQRDKARGIGLSLALGMRLGLLAGISWIVSLTTPLVTYGSLSLSGRDLILLAGGLFLTFKATMELHERIEGGEHQTSGPAVHAPFGSVVAQIILLDLVFSIDSVITAVGMVDNLAVMMAAVILSMGVMLFASKPLARFVNEHPTVVVLCLAFLLMIGFSLVAEAFHVHVPKGYLYAAIGFSIVIETFNQLRQRNVIRAETARPFRIRTAEQVMRLLGERPADEDQPSGYAEAERHLVSGVLSLAERPLATWMTRRQDIVWLDATHSRERLRDQLLASVHGVLPVGDGSLDRPIGIVRIQEALSTLDTEQSLASLAARRKVPVVPDTVSALDLVPLLRGAEAHLALLVDEKCQVTGLVSPVDLLGAITRGTSGESTPAVPA